MKRITTWCIGVLLVLGTNISMADNANQFVAVKGTHFSFHNKAYYITGSNLWYGGYLGSAGKVGDHARLIKELDNLQAMGINNLRVMAVSEKSDLSSAVNPATTNGFGQYDEELLAGMDYLLTEMARRNMTVVLYLNNFWQWSGGMTQYLSWIEGTSVQDPEGPFGYNAFMAKSATFYQSARAQREYRNTIKKLVTRVNTITHKLYSDDPTIMSWQLANEPRPGNDGASDHDKAVYIQWVNDTAKYIHELDANHLVTTGSEGLKGSAEDAKVYVDAHASPYINYMTCHLWPKNWSWYNRKKPEATFADAVTSSKAYLNDHIGMAKKLGKPIVLEEFGLDRDDGAYDVKSTTHYRDRFYGEVFALLYQHAKAGDPSVGFNFWAWNGSARTSNANYRWHTGDDFMGDPPQEEQGMNGVFDSDVSTILLIKQYSDRMHALK